MESHSQSTPEKAIEREPYYHGLLPREDVKMMLTKNGDFLIRMSEPKKGEPRSFILSVMHNTQLDESQAIKHFVIKNASNKFMIEKYSFDTIQQMIEHHISTKEGIRDDVLITKPIYRQHWELDHENITVTKKLGEGAFGEVSMGVLKLKKLGKTVNVAIKQAKLEKVTKEQIKEFMSEARMMRQFNHPNVVRFYGVAAGTEPLYMVMELASNGALDSFLQKNPDLPFEKKNEMILQAAWGLEYLHSKPVLHRDIAARNCLYGDGKVKISDFGLTRAGTVYQMDPSRKVPIRWLAVETLKQQIYSQKTDVWSYGIMAWEIFSNGVEPYPGMTVAEVNQQVREGYRMTIPPNVNQDIQRMITGKCWAESPNDRYTMAEIATCLQKITAIPRPNFQAIAAQLAAEQATLNHVTTKTNKRKKKGLPRGMPTN